MPPSSMARRLLVPGGALLAFLAGCGPSPSPAPPPPPPAATATAVASAAATATAVASAAPSTAPEPTSKKVEAEAIDYGSAPKPRCIARANIPPPPAASRSLAERRTQKHELAKKILASGALYLELDARKPGVVVPPGYQQAGRLVLIVGYDLPQPIPDLAVDAAGVSGQLLFKMKRFSVQLPWDAVYGLMNQDDDLSRWSEDVPADVICADGGDD